MRGYAQTLPQPFVKRLNLRCSQLDLCSVPLAACAQQKLLYACKNLLAVGHDCIAAPCLSSHWQPVHSKELVYCVLASCLAADSGAHGAVEAVLSS